MVFAEPADFVERSRVQGSSGIANCWLESKPESLQFQKRVRRRSSDQSQRFRNRRDHWTATATRGSERIRKGDRDELLRANRRFASEGKVGSSHSACELVFFCN